MPSPFPGMDPNLEGPLWTTLHFSLGAEIVRQLAPRLRPRYVVLPVERFVLEISSDLSPVTTTIYPDVAVTEGSPRPSSIVGAAATITAPLHLATVMPTPVPHVSIEVRDAANRQLVTVIEILPPTNKRGEGREEYLVRRQRILLSRAHLLEIDLLRSGQRVPMQQPLPDAPYFVFLSQAETRPLSEVWPIQLDQPLPAVPVPLLPPDPDTVLDLQAAFTAAYDLMGYDLMIDYDQAPEE
ncbi:MAG: DUF4058 family protein [Chloroflexi bacterium]|nr:DUF4058 family protein [Chloroflexota bacterium]MCI0577284.1 DUF4058 family protein [Chloroflexota bacterium]MCI0647728.1 DUF4058 family protein [Chloroflexota bacterium]MCI0731592.1 DUF4058 family protein [Chloroflexota bacterium]